MMNEQVEVTREQVINAMQILYDCDHISFKPLSNKIVSDVKDVESGVYRKSITFCGFQFHTRSGALYENMKGRCNGNKPAYIDCTISEEWLDSFESFANWSRSQIGYFQKDECGNSFELDSDLLSNGNKRYSAESCTFLPAAINTAIARNGSVGCYQKPSGKWRAQYSKYGKVKYIGLFDTKRQAVSAYKKARKAYIKELANKYKLQISSSAYDALMTYKQK
jgi:hypothetical protein